MEPQNLVPPVIESPKNNTSKSIIVVIIFLLIGFFLFFKFNIISTPSISQDEYKINKITDKQDGTFIFPKVNITQSGGYTIIKAEGIENEGDIGFDSYINLLSPLDNIKAIRGEKISLIFAVSPKVKSLLVSDFSGDKIAQREVDSSGYLWHVDYTVPIHIYDTSSTYTLYVSAYDGISKESLPNPSNINIEITNPESFTDIKSAGVKTYTATNTVSGKSFSIDYPEELTYSERRNAEGKITSIQFNDGNNQQSWIEIVDPAIFEKGLIDPENNPDGNEGQTLQGVEKIGNNKYKLYTDSIPMHSELNYYIKNGSMGLWISNNTYFGAMGPSPSFRELYIDLASLKFN
jgi:hypothetical protein